MLPAAAAAAAFGGKGGFCTCDIKNDTQHLRLQGNYVYNIKHKFKEQMICIYIVVFIKLLLFFYNFFMKTNQRERIVQYIYVCKRDLFNFVVTRARAARWVVVKLTDINQQLSAKPM